MEWMNHIVEIDIFYLPKWIDRTTRMATFDLLRIEFLRIFLIRLQWKIGRGRKRLVDINWGWGWDIFDMNYPSNLLKLTVKKALSM